MSKIFVIEPNNPEEIDEIVFDAEYCMDFCSLTKDKKDIYIKNSCGDTIFIRDLLSLKRAVDKAVELGWGTKQ